MRISEARELLEILGDDLFVTLSIAEPSTDLAMELRAKGWATYQRESDMGGPELGVVENPDGNA